MNSFRDFEKSLCILWDRACINILDPDQVSGANGILCYGYVDHAAGLTFEGLAFLWMTREAPTGATSPLGSGKLR